MNRTIIFDFDGTIADSLPIILKIYTHVLPGGPQITKELFHLLRKLPAHKVAAKLDISLWRLPWLLKKGRKKMHDHLDEVLPFDGISDVLKELQNRGYKLQIVTSNSRTNVVAFLEMNNMTAYFDQVSSVRRLNGKPRVLKRIVSRQKLVMAETYYVGDEARDVMATQKVGMPIVAVAWGFNDATLLREMKPTAVIETPKELLDIFKKDKVQL